METVTTISLVLKAERKRLQLTQGELADKLECTQQNLSEIERGVSHPSPKLLDKMLEVFGHDSPLAYVARKGEVRPPPVGPRVVISTVEPPSSRPHRPDSHWEAEVVNSMPPELRGYWQHTKCAVDYVSPSLAVEVKYSGASAAQSLLTLARLGMQQVCVAKAMLTGQRTYALVLVFEGAAMLRPERVGSIHAEAALLGIQLVFCPDASSAGKAIGMLETEVASGGLTLEYEEDY